MVGILRPARIVEKNSEVDDVGIFDLVEKIPVHRVSRVVFVDEAVEFFRGIANQTRYSLESFEARVHRTEHRLLVESIGVVLTDLGRNG